MSLEYNDELELEYCYKCGGVGRVTYRAMSNEGNFLFEFKGTCPKCYGKCMLDWIEQITGVDPPEDPPEWSPGFGMNPKTLSS